MTQSTKEKSQNGEVKPTSPNSDLKLDFDSFWSYSDAPESSDHIKLKEKYNLFINGEFVEGKKSRTINTINPATEKPLAEFTEATSEDIDLAVKSARKAYEKTWSKLTGKERGKYI
jgi:aldehyde dehydrogenase (NAD+)